MTVPASLLRLNRQMKDLVRIKYNWPLNRTANKNLRYYMKWPGVYNSVDLEYDVLLATDKST